MAFAPTHAGPLRFEVAGGGPDLVLVHELGGSAASFDEMMPALRASFRVLRYDQSGCGESAPASRPLSMDDQAAQLGEVIAAAGLGPRCRLVGVAAGAAIAVAFALSQPEKVASLALCAPALAVPPARRAYLEERSSLALAGGMESVVEASLARSYPVALRSASERYTRYRTRFLTTNPRSYAEANRALAAMRIEARLDELAMPCLVLAGRHDLLRPPEDVEALARRIRRARSVTLDSGHLMPVQAPQEMALHLIAFLAQHDSAMAAGAHADA